MNVRRFYKLSGAAAAATLALCGAADAFDYSVEFDGAPNGLRQKLAGVSALSAERREIATTAALRRTAKNDLGALKTALQAAGYYAGEARFSIEMADGADHAKVVYHIDTGPLFHITDYVISYTDEDGADRPSSLAEADVKADGAADGAALQKLQQSFLSALWNKGFPGARIVSRRAEADLAKGEARAVFVFESGPHATFGDLRIDGAEATAKVYLEKLKTWTPGEPFERAKLVAYRDKLASTGIFTSVDVSPGAPGPDGSAPVLVTVKERKRRTIGAGVSYSTSEGPGGRIFFDYRNAFHRGETVRVEMAGSQIEQSLSFNFNKPLPDFPGTGYSTLAFSNETTDAYDARTITLGAGLSRKWLDNRLETRGGLAFETSKVRTDVKEERTYFLSAPLSATWSTENSLLNPTKGERAVLSVTPYTGSGNFTIAELNARSRVTFGGEDRFTLAYRGRLGSVFGSSLNDLPSNKRFYAGGGASVRGYAYQEAGPLDADGVPTGGRSVIEGAVEARAIVVKDIQLAAFVDAGSIAAQSIPDFGGNFFVGVGGGVRYLSPVGPIRVDVGLPLDKRVTDRNFQIYVSLGQAF